MTLHEKLDRLNHLINTVITLTEDETLMIKSSPKAEELRPVSDAKRQAIADYEQYLQLLAATPHFFNSLNDDTKTSLRTISERLQTVITENEQALKFALQATEIISNRIKDEAKKAMGTTFQSYNASGYTSGGSEKRTTPIAVNQTL